MPYSYSTYAQIKTQLAGRLDDPNKTYWLDGELGIYLKEAFRTFGVCSGFWRERGTFSTVANTAFYSLGANLSNGVQLLLAPTVTDRLIIERIQFALLEHASSQTSWNGTEMFTFQNMVDSVQNCLNNFIADTGIPTRRSVVNVASPPIGRQVLDQKTIDVRRVAWIGSSPENYYTTLWREDERMLTAADQGWSVNPGAPEMYSIMAPPPLQLQISPIPQSNGQLELLTVDSISIDPANVATVLPIPDDLSPAISWGAMADLLGKDGIARDPIRAQYCDEKYQKYVQMARVMPVIVHAEINGVPLIPVTMQEMDASTPNWENIVADVMNPVKDLIIASQYLVALSAVPDQPYSVTCDVVRNTPTYIDTDLVQIGREQLDGIIDYAEHLALFKVGGAEWHATDRQAQDFIRQAVTYNQRISAAVRSSMSSSEQSIRQKKEIPRRLNDSAVGVGAVKVGPDARR